MTRLYNDVHNHVETRKIGLIKEFRKFYDVDRKSFAMSIATHPDKHLLFKAYDDKDLQQYLVLEALDIFKLGEPCLK